MSLHSHPSVSDESQKSDLTDLHDVLEDAWRGCFSGILEFWGLGQQGTISIRMKTRGGKKVSF